MALKGVIHGGGLANLEEMARFRIEAEAAARMQHPNIVQIYDVYEHDGRRTTRWSWSRARGSIGTRPPAAARRTGSRLGSHASIGRPTCPRNKSSTAI